LASECTSFREPVRHGPPRGDFRDAVEKLWMVCASPVNCRWSENISVPGTRQRRCGRPQCGAAFVLSFAFADTCQVTRIRFVPIVIINPTPSRQS
jgi:hypothetical protein